MRSWLLVLYRMPREPNTARVSTWRKLRRLAAVAIHDAVWALPDAAWRRDRLTWVAAEVVELGGDAILREARVAQGQDEHLVAQFITQADTECREILAELQREGASWWAFRVAITWPVSAIISTQTSGAVYARPSCGSEE